MTRVLAIAVIVAQLLDVATWAVMPAWAEANPFVAGLHTETAWALKVMLLELVFLVALLTDRRLRRPIRGRVIPEWVYRTIVEFVAVLAIMAGALGAGSNLTAIAYARAAEAPRPALLSLATLSTLPGSTASPSGLPAARTPVPGSNGGAQAPDLTGRASWFRAEASVAAAGPGLRHALGRHWRGTWVRVTAGDRSVTVRLGDWCQCYKGQRGERLVDLSDDAFAELAPLAVGILRVRVSAIVPPATDR